MPYLGSTIFVVTLLAATLLSLTAWWLFVRALAPGFVERCRDRWRARPVVSVLLGAVVGGFSGIAATLLLSVAHPAAKILGVVILTAALALALAGAGGLAARIGQGLASPTDAGRAWFQTLKGGLVLELTYLVPLLGWFVILPLSVLGGLGAALQSLVAALFALPVVRADARSA